ncbi:FTR1 family iron permease [Rhizobium sullae]|uniref:FTR1 family iron permease n=1 Tax=Rhizobium sullae TaxID=50338 RepID=UPI000B34BE83|nr:FTR1 family protein [Rhizobium sullae]
MTLTGAQAFQVTFVVWRESLEALLVVGILATWSLRGGPERKRKACLALAAGIASGLLLALSLAVVLVSFESFLSGDGQDILQLVMVAAAACLIVHMVMWMRRGGGQMSSELGAVARRSSELGKWLGLSILTAVAIGREGSETVVFLYGLLAGASGTGVLSNLVSATLGIFAAGLSYLMLRWGASALSWNLFFRVSEALLLVVGAGLLMTAVDRAIGLGLVAPLSGPIWDTSRVLDDGSGLGAFIAGLSGYRARPELFPLLLYAAYWLAIGYLLRPRRQLSLAA